MTRWIVISDASRARIFEADEHGVSLHLVDSCEHPQSRARVRDLMADANGRKPAGTPPGHRGSAARPGSAPDTDPKWVEAQKFARELAARLDSGLQRHAYDHLVVAAPPQFLGLLRHTLSDQVKARLELWLDKDLTHHPLQAIESDVAAQLRA